MTQNLPDIATLDIPMNPMPLEWVGMEGIDLPVVIEEANYRRELHARVDAQVNLPRPNIRGIHMSRLHHLVDSINDGNGLTPGSLCLLLAAMVDSHEDCDSDRARVRLGLSLLVRRGALKSADIGGWQSYPVTLEATGNTSGIVLSAEICVVYSSTCPCSASLSRQLIEREFLTKFGKLDEVSVADAAAWLRDNATVATPHSQRSKARVRVGIDPGAADFGLLRLIDRVETAVATPVQTAVKRIDEQAFAALNGKNLMFVEDAARRIRSALKGSYGEFDVKVTHMESLHPHDAVARTQS